MIENNLIIVSVFFFSALILFQLFPLLFIFISVPLIQLVSSLLMHFLFLTINIQPLIKLVPSLLRPFPFQFLTIQLVIQPSVFLVMHSIFIFLLPRLIIRLFTCHLMPIFYQIQLNQAKILLPLYLNNKIFLNSRKII